MIVKLQLRLEGGRRALATLFLLLCVGCWHPIQTTFAFAGAGTFLS
jgi:hypothetical protein